MRLKWWIYACAVTLFTLSGMAIADDEHGQGHGKGQGKHHGQDEDRDHDRRYYSDHDRDEMRDGIASTVATCRPGWPSAISCLQGWNDSSASAEPYRQG